MMAYQVYVERNGKEEIIGNYQSAMIASLVMERKGEDAHMRAVETDEQDHD